MAFFPSASDLLFVGAEQKPASSPLLLRDPISSGNGVNPIDIIIHVITHRLRYTDGLFGRLLKNTADT